MSTGAKVVVWAIQQIGEDAIPEPSFTADADHAQRLDCTGRFAVDPLVRQADHLAELEAARIKALEEAASLAGDEVTHLERDLDDPHQADGARRVHEAIRALIWSAPPTPDNAEHGG